MGQIEVAEQFVCNCHEISAYFPPKSFKIGVFAKIVDYETTNIISQTDMLSM